MSVPAEPRAPFPLTRWSLVLSSRAEENDAALEGLCHLYWAPLYTCCRRSGLSIEDSEDLTQRFFHDLVKDRAALLADASPDAGRLRTLFLRVLQRRIIDYHRHHTRGKRGGREVHLPLDTAAAEASLHAIAGTTASPEDVFERQWALNILQLALTRHEKAFTAAGRAHHFQALAPFLGLTGAEPDYTTVQQVLGISETAARQTVHRFRDRFRTHLREEIAHTIADTNDTAIDRELEDLRRVLRR